MRPSIVDLKRQNAATMAYTNLAVIAYLYLFVIGALLILSFILFVGGILTFLGKAEVSQRVKLSGGAAFAMGMAMLFGAFSFLCIAAIVFRHALR